MSDIKKGEIHWVDIPPAQTVGSEQYKGRPYVIVSRTAVNKAGRIVVGVPLSTQLHKANQHRIQIPIQEIVLDAGCAVSMQTSVALTDQIRVLDVARLQQPRLGTLTASAIIALELGLAFLFDIR